MLRLRHSYKVIINFNTSTNYKKATLNCSYKSSNDLKWLFKETKRRSMECLFERGFCITKFTSESKKMRIKYYTTHLV